MVTDRSDLEDWKESVQADEKLNRDKGFNTERALGNLLAIIHRDGGHYIVAHGWKVACSDAENIVANLRMQVDDLTLGKKIP